MHMQFTHKHTHTHTQTHAHVPVENGQYVHTQALELR